MGSIKWVRLGWAFFCMCGSVALAAEVQDIDTPTVSEDFTTNRDAPFVQDRVDGVVLTRPNVVSDGQLLIVNVAVPEACGAPTLQWLGRIHTAYRRNEHFDVLLPVPLGSAESIQAQVQCREFVANFEIPIVPGDFPESQLRVDPKFDTKPPARVRAENRAMYKACERSHAGRLWQTAFTRPAMGIDTSPYGVRRTFNGKLESRHRGLDLDGKEGDPIVAANDGIVVLVGEDYYFTGNTVFIDHGDHLFTTYFHMLKIDVKVGQQVKKGQIIGAIGKTGRVTGPHLHFGVKIVGHYISPNDLLAYDPQRLETVSAQLLSETTGPR